MGRLLFGVGVNDAGYVVNKLKELPKVAGRRVRGQVWRCPYYGRWAGMLRRCYSETERHLNPTYADCTVVDSWLIFSNFRKWMLEQDWEEKHLDKDLKVKSNKVYGPDTCLFVSGAVNAFINDNKGTRGAYAQGVYYEAGRKKFQSACKSPFTKKKVHLGRFKTEEGAHQAWLKQKRKFAVQLAEIQTNSEVAEALLRYQL